MLLLWMTLHRNRMSQQIVHENVHFLKVIQMHRRRPMIHRKNPSNYPIDYLSSDLVSCRTVEGYREDHGDAHPSTSEDDSLNKSNDQETVES